MDTEKSWKNLELFKDMDNDEKEAIMAHPGWIRRFYDPGGSIHQAGESLGSLIILIDGWVEGGVVTEAGRQLNLTRRKGPALIGPAMVFGDNREILKIRATGPAELMKLSKEHLRELFESHPLLLDNFLRVCSQRFHFLSNRLELLGFHSIRKKIAHHILDQYELHGSPFLRERSMTSLAEHMAVERPSLSAVFHAMRREGLFRVEGKKVFVDAPDKLRDELERD